MKLITDEGQVYNMVPAENQGELEKEIQLYVGGVRYVGEVVENKNNESLTKEECLIKHCSHIMSEAGSVDGWDNDIYPAMEEWAKHIALLFYEHEESVSPENIDSNYDYFISKINSTK